MDVEPRAFDIKISRDETVSALLWKPPKASACYVFAHGAGAGMNHAFMQAISAKLAALNVATLRYQFPYMQRCSRRPDRPEKCHTAVRAAVALARKKLPTLPLIAGGKSFGGRMTSQAQALEPLPGVVGLAFFGFPWHSPKTPSAERSEHLDVIKIPMFFMQGGRDNLGDPRLVKAQVRKRHVLATLLTVPEADHGFHVPSRSGQTDAEVQTELAIAFVKWAGIVGKISRTSRHLMSKS